MNTKQKIKVVEVIIIYILCPMPQHVSILALSRRGLTTLIKEESALVSYYNFLLVEKATFLRINTAPPSLPTARPSVTEEAA